MSSTFWSAANVEPKRNFRFKVQLGMGSTSEVAWWAKTVTLPAWDLAEVEHNYLDNKYYFPGRLTWSDVSLTLVDPISVNAVERTNAILTDHQNYSVKKDSAGTSTVTKPASATPLTVIITIYDATGATVVEQWTIKQAFIKSAKYGDLDYSSDDLKTVELTFRYDWAECTTKQGSQAAVTSFEPK